MSTRKAKQDRSNFGALFKNSFKTAETHPDYRGKISIDSSLVDAADADGELELSAWLKVDKNGDRFLSLSVSEVYKKDATVKAAKPVAQKDYLDGEDL